MVPEKELVEFFAGLQKLVANWIETMCICTIHSRGGHIFRASTNFMGNVWRDWVLINFGESGNLPCHIMGFVDLRFINESYNLSFGGLSPISSGLHAIVECANPNYQDNNGRTSEIFIPLIKEIRGMTQEHISHRNFCLVDVETFVRPIAVVPDLGGPSHAHLQIKMRKYWKNDFINWLKSPSPDPSEYESNDDEDEETYEEDPRKS